MLQPDGKIVTGGGTGTQTDFVVVRQMPSGLLDSTFDGDGKVRTDFGGVQRIHGLVVQSNGRIVGGEQRVAPRAVETLRSPVTGQTAASM